MICPLILISVTALFETGAGKGTRSSATKVVVDARRKIDATRNVLVIDVIQNNMSAISTLRLPFCIDIKRYRCSVTSRKKELLPASEQDGIACYNSGWRGDMHVTCSAPLSSRVRTEDSQSSSTQPSSHMSLILLLAVFGWIRWGLREWVKNRSNS